MNQLRTLLLLLILSFASCNKSRDCDNSDLYSYLTSQQKGITPYKGMEIVKYKSTEGDTLIFRCSNSNQRFYKTQKVGENIDCARPWYLEILDYHFICFQDSSKFFQISNKVSTEYSFSILDIVIAGQPSIKSEGYNLTHINHFKDSLLINGVYNKALTIYYNDGGVAGKWVQGYGLAQINMGSKYYTIYE